MRQYTTFSPMDETNADQDHLPPLLALCQSAALIDHVAATGTMDRDAMEYLLDALLQDNGGDIEPVVRLHIGRRTLDELLRGDLPANQARIPFYMHAMLRLEGKLRRRPELRQQLARRLARARQLRRHFAARPEAVYSAVAGAYTDTVGQLDSPVPVTGALRQIASLDKADIIRCCLLGGVQAAGQWRAAGGRPWQLRWRRRALLRQLRSR